jgi:hypothetical protein
MTAALAIAGANTDDVAWNSGAASDHSMLGFADSSADWDDTSDPGSIITARGAYSGTRHNIQARFASSTYAWVSAKVPAAGFVRLNLVYTGADVAVGAPLVRFGLSLWHDAVETLYVLGFSHDGQAKNTGEHAFFDTSGNVLAYNGVFRLVRSRASSLNDHISMTAPKSMWSNPRDLWEPTEITTALWLDASDPTTITAVAGAVSQWNDKSGNLRHATQGTLAARPIIGSMVTFDGTDDFMNVTTAAFQGQAAPNFFYVFRYNKKLADYMPEMSMINSAAGDDGAFHYITPGNAGASYPLRKTGGWDIYDPAGSYSVGAVELISFATTAGSTYSVYQNGTREGGGSATGTPGATYIGLRLAAQLPANRFTGISLAEIIVMFGATSSNRVLVEGYLAHKWGIQAKLPADHTYFANAPFSAIRRRVWVPSDETLALWLDASDSTTISAESNSVSQWSDKSGNSRHAMQATAANKPKNNGTALNSLTVITFDGTNDYMDVTTTAFQSQGKPNVFYVFRHDGNGSGDGYYPEICMKAGGDDGTFHYVRSTGGGASYPFNVMNSWGSYDPAGSYSAADAQVMSFATLSTAWTVYKNGSSEGTGTIGTAPDSAYTGMRLAHQPTKDRYANISLAEIIVIFGASDATRKKAEGYLAYKWGLRGGLPADHPYKSNRPTTII